MKIVLIIFLLLLNLNGFSQETITLSPHVSVTLPIGAKKHVDKELEGVLGEYAIAFKSLIESSYIVDDVVFRVNPVRCTVDRKYLSETKRFGDGLRSENNNGSGLKWKSEIKSVNGFEVLFTFRFVNGREIRDFHCVDSQMKYGFEGSVKCNPKNSSFANDIILAIIKSAVFKS